MATITDSDILDLVSGTMLDLGRGRFQQIAQALTEYEVMGKWLKKDRMVFDSGRGIQRTLMTKTAGAAKHVGLFETDDLDLKSLLTQLNVPWRRATTYWIFERREVLENKGQSLIVNVLEPRRAGAYIDLAAELETRAWQAPAAADDKMPYGLPYYLVKNASTGFTGALPSDHTTVAGVNLTSHPGYKNYAGLYTAISKEDLIAMMRTARRKTKFKSPVTIRDYRGDLGDRFRLYVNEATIAGMETLGEAQNENLGRDLFSMDGQITFGKNPIVYVPELDGDTTNPVYMIDQSTFYPVILKGDYLRETEPAKAPNQHNVFVVHVDLSYNFLCVDRRRNTVLATSV